MSTQNLQLSDAICTLLLFCLLASSSSFLLATPTHAETTITNNVSVYANSNDTNHAAVTTVVNDAVVENWSTSSTSPITYTNTFSTDSATIDTTINTSHPTDRDHMVALIDQLQALIALYVSLLSS